MKKYLIGVLYYGPIDREHDRCVQALKNHPLISRVFEMHGCPYIDIGRSTIATEVLDQPDIGGVLFLDHDILFDFEEVTKIIESTEASEGVVGAGYSMRRPGSQMIGGIDNSKIPEGENVVFFNGGKRWPAIYLGMGFTCIHRKALERIVETANRIFAERQERLAKLREAIENRQDLLALTILDSMTAALDFKEHELPQLKSGITDANVVPFFSLIQSKGSYFGEDVSFCLRAYAANVPVEMDTRLRIYHKGSYTYGLEDCGMVVPYCTTLISLPSDTPQPQNSQHSHLPEVQRALDAQKVELEQRRTVFPDSTDPLALPAETAPRKEGAAA